MRLSGILETVVYCAPGTREGVESLYSDALGLQEVARWEDGTSFRIGPGVLLVFDAGKLAERDGPIADHGAKGPGHVCFTADPAEYEGWRDRLGEHGVEITHEEKWPSGRRSFYFRDPAGNLLEIAEGDLWPS